MSEVGLLIKRAREYRNMTQGALATAIGLAQPNISQIESGDWAAPRDVLISIARVLQSPEILLGALRHSPILAEVLSMLGVDRRNPDPVALIARIRDELDLLESDLVSTVADPATRAGAVTDMCRMLTLLLVSRDRSR